MTDNADRMSQAWLQRPGYITPKLPVSCRRWEANLAKSSIRIGLCMQGPYKAAGLLQF